MGNQRIQGEVEEGREEPGKVSAVQYVRFKVPDALALVKGPAALVIDHPSYAHRAEIPGPARRSLAQDLA